MVNELFAYTAKDNTFAPARGVVGKTGKAGWPANKCSDTYI